MVFRFIGAEMVFSPFFEWRTKFDGTFLLGYICIVFFVFFFSLDDGIIKLVNYGCIVDFLSVFNTLATLSSRWMELALLLFTRFLC